MPVTTRRNATNPLAWGKFVFIGCINTRVRFFTSDVADVSFVAMNGLVFPYEDGSLLGCSAVLADVSEVLAASTFTVTVST